MSDPMQQLQQMADQVATQMVASSMRRLLGGHVTVTVEAEPARPVRALLGPAKRRGRKPASKRGRPRKVVEATPAPQPAPRGLDVSSRTCRKCFRKGTAKLISGSERTVKCSQCFATWDIRIKGSEAGVVRRAVANNAAATCGRCDHDKSAHIGPDSKCLVPRCTCTEFYA